MTSGRHTVTVTITINAVINPPVATFSASKTTVYVNDTITFTDASTNTPTTWAWDFGDGTTSTVKNPTHSYTSVGTYTVKLTATNADGSDDEIKTNYITVTVVKKGCGGSTSVDLVLVGGILCSIVIIINKRFKK